MMMTGEDCDQQAIDFKWSLARENACHLAVQNHEMGEMRDEMIEMNSNVSETFMIIKNDIQNMQYVQNITIWIWGIIASTLIIMAVKKIFAPPIKAKT
jgi:hypothetical protein